MIIEITNKRYRNSFHSLFQQYQTLQDFFCKHWLAKSNLRRTMDTSYLSLLLLSLKLRSLMRKRKHTFISWHQLGWQQSKYTHRDKGQTLLTAGVRIQITTRHNGHNQWTWTHVGHYPHAKTFMISAREWGIYGHSCAVGVYWINGTLLSPGYYRLISMSVPRWQPPSVVF